MLRHIAKYFGVGKKEATQHVTNGKPKQKKYSEDQARVYGRVNLRRRIEEELTPENCPVGEIVPRFRSIMEDIHFGSFIQLPEFSKNHIELRKVFKRENIDTAPYRNGPMAELFIDVFIANASRVLPEDAIDFVRSVFWNNAFTKLNCDWVKRDDKEKTNKLFSFGLLPLSERIAEEDKIKFFRACETKKHLKIFVEDCASSDDVAAFLFNIFGNMKASDVNDVLFQTDIFENIPLKGREEEYARAFGKLRGPGIDPELPDVLTKYIGYVPYNNSRLSFKGHYPSYDDYIA